jgi:competence protein ComEC
MARFPLFAVALAALSLAPVRAAKTLDVFFIDVEGGQATLFVAPSGQSLLVDTGWRGFDGRDAQRIKLAAKKAHIKRIDYVMITHYHRDHVGGVPALANIMKIGAFIDHGPNREDSKVTREDYSDYERTLPKASGHMVVKPGDKIPVKGLDITVVAADGNHITTPLPGAGQPNPYCANAAQHENDPSENARSVGIVMQYGKFRLVDLGDLTWNKELALMCPNNPIGTVDVFVVSHHGMFLSNSPQLVDAIHPRVAIMDNGARKGGSPQAWQTVHDSPGLEDLWQLHFALAGGSAHNSPDPMIANIDAKCQGLYLRLIARDDGGFTVYNSRNKYEKTYAPR